MTQTTHAIPRSNYKVEVSTNGSAWTDISGQAATVTTDGGEQITGAQHTASGKYAIVTGAKKLDPITVTVSAVYTEQAAEAFLVVYAAAKGSAPSLYLRFSPNGGGAGDERFTTSNDGSTAAAAPIVSCSEPDLDAESGDPALFEFSVITPALLMETVGT